MVGRNCPKQSASSTKHINFNKMVFVLKHFTFIFRFEAVFIFPSWFHWIKKKKRAPGQHPLEDPYCGRIWVKLKGRGGGARWWHQVVAPSLELLLLVGSLWTCIPHV